MIKTLVYDEGEKVMGEVEMHVEKNKYLDMMKGLKIRNLTSGGERCHPLAVLHTVSSSGIIFKLFESKSKSNTTMSLYNNYQHQQQLPDTPLFALHSTCLRDNKTAVVMFGEEEIHLVAMRSRSLDSRTACFWGFSVAPGVYECCLGMLNLRCLGIVFDLDETLIVANTLRSFEDRIESLQRKISTETDSQRIAGMVAEVKRYQDDKAILKQYAETDQVVDNGKVHKIQAEVVPALSDNHQTVVRPLIRLPDKNIVLTRINPQIRDTSVLVRLRPAWEDLRSYLTARGRKRFEVYVCTMAERDYALEMWRLLDPDSNLISTTEVLDRIVCVKSGSKKSLFNVFHDGICHPKMALVIDDRLKVWDENDQPRVHVVPAFAPYYAPQAEGNNAIPVLCVARNVACNVRGGFFKEFDDVLLQRVNEVFFEDAFNDVPSSPDVSNYLVSEDDGSTTNGNKEPLPFDGMADAEVERRLKEASTAPPSVPSAPPSASINPNSRLASSLQFSIAAAPPMTIPQPTPQASITPFPANMFSQAGPLARPLGNLGPHELIMHNSPAQEEGEVSESEVDPDTRRRLLILQHGMDFRDNLLNEPPFSVRPPVQTPLAGPVPGPGPVQGPGPGPGPVPVVAPAPGPGPVPPLVPGPGPGPGPGPSPGPNHGPVPRVQPRGVWFPEDHVNPGPLSRPVAREYPVGPDALHFEKQRPPPPFQRRMESSGRSDRTFFEKQRPPREAPRRDDRLRSNLLLPSHQSFKGDDISLSRSSSNKDLEVAPERGTSLPESPAAALHDIALRCGTKAEFRLGLVPAAELKFLTEVYFAGEKIGEGTGAKRRGAQLQAAEAALMNLADRYLTHKKLDSGTPQCDTSRGQSPGKLGLFSSDANSFADRASTKEGTIPSGATVKMDGSNVVDSTNSNSISSVSALKELCTREGLNIDFKAPSHALTNQGHGDEKYAEVEIDGQVVGKGSGQTWDEAKIQAAENALVSLKSKFGQLTQKLPVSPQSLEGLTGKRSKPEYSEALECMPPSKYPRNTSPVP